MREIRADATRFASVLLFCRKFAPLSHAFKKDIEKKLGIK